MTLQSTGRGGAKGEGKGTLRRYSGVYIILVTWSNRTWGIRPQCEDLPKLTDWSILWSSNFFIKLSVSLMGGERLHAPLGENACREK